MNNPLGVSPSKGNQGTTRGKEKNLLTSEGIEHTTSGLDLPLPCRLSYDSLLCFPENFSKYDGGNTNSKLLSLLRVDKVAS